MRKNKYNNKKTIVDGIKFDSKKEAKRYTELKKEEQKGTIKNLKLQPKFLLNPTVRYDGTTYKKVSYKADFMYTKNDEIVVEDVKGYKTEIYKLKKKIFLNLYGSKYKFIET